MKYLDRDQVAGFHVRFPMSKKGKSVMENHLTGIKEAMQVVVEVSILSRETAPCLLYSEI